jgi:hypothetical protein
MTGRTYRVHVTTEHADWHARLEQIPRADGEDIHDARVRHIEATGETLLRIGHGEFYWICPGCGGCAGGTLGEQPVSGWDAPRWVMTGPLDRPTFTPSLGCPTWRRGKCEGHWWLRDGNLVLA